jgi:hypothetical protein
VGGCEGGEEEREDSDKDQQSQADVRSPHPHVRWSILSALLSLPPPLAGTRKRRHRDPQEAVLYHCKR